MDIGRMRICVCVMLRKWGREMILKCVIGVIAIVGLFAFSLCYIAKEADERRDRIWKHCRK